MKTEDIGTNLLCAATAVYGKCEEAFADKVSQVMLYAKARIAGLEQERERLFEDLRRLKKADRPVELHRAGELLGVFSSEQAAKDYMEKYWSDSSFSIYPLGTTMQTDIKVSPFELRAADTMARIIDDMVDDGKLSSRSPLADARLDYGQPHEYKHTKEE